MLNFRFSMAFHALRVIGDGSWRNLLVLIAFSTLTFLSSFTSSVIWDSIGLVLFASYFPCLSGFDSNGGHDVRLNWCLHCHARPITSTSLLAVLVFW